MIAFIFLFVFRSLAGVHNGYGYAKNEMFRTATAIVLTLIAIACGVLLIDKDINTIWFFTEPIRKNLGYLACLLSILGIWGVENSFSKKYKFLPQDIHFWEIIKTGGVTFVFLLGGWDFWLIAAHLYPSLLLHKGFINLGAGLPFFDVRTDDPTGRTFSVPFLKEILDFLFPNRKWLKEGRIYREPLWLRITLAIFSVLFVFYKIFF